MKISSGFISYELLLVQFSSIEETGHDAASLNHQQSCTNEFSVVELS